jgi:hypothetical protein
MGDIRRQRNFILALWQGRLLGGARSLLLKVPNKIRGNDTMTPLLLAVVPIIFLCIAGILNNETIGE